VLDWWILNYNDWPHADVSCNAVSGQLLVLLRRLDSNSSLQQATATVTRQRIRNIMDAAGYVSDAAIPYIQLRQPKYFNGTVINPWLLCNLCKFYHSEFVSYNFIISFISFYLSSCRPKCILLNLLLYSVSMHLRLIILGKSLLDFITGFSVFLSLTNKRIIVLYVMCRKF